MIKEIIRTIHLHPMDGTPPKRAVKQKLIFVTNDSGDFNLQSISDIGLPFLLK